MCTENYELAQQEAVLFAKQHLALAAQNIERLICEDYNTVNLYDRMVYLNHQSR